MIEAYPLQWPIGQHRTNSPERSRFGAHTLPQVTKMLLKEIERLRGSNPIISTNIPLRLDGMPRADYQKRQITDKGVAVYFTRKNKQVVLACDAWDTIEDNIWSVALTIEAMRALDRWKVSEILDRTFTGLGALPAPGESTTRACWDILGIAATKNVDEISKQYRNKARAIANDEDALRELNGAKEEAIKYARQ